MLAHEGRDLSEVIERSASRQRLHLRRRGLPTQRLVEIKAELGQKCRLQPLQPGIQVRRLHCLLGLTSEQVLAGLALALEHVSPPLQFSVSAMQVEQRGQEVPL